MWKAWKQKYEVVRRAGDDDWERGSFGAPKGEENHEPTGQQVIFSGWSRAGSNVACHCSSQSPERGEGPLYLIRSTYKYTVVRMPTPLT